MAKSRWFFAGSSVAAVLLLTILTLPVARSEESAQPETQKVILENEFVRVLDIRVPAGVFEAKHSHARGVIIALTDYDNDTKSIPDGKVSHLRSKFGDVKWVEPVTHESRNSGTGEQHVIRIEMKKDAPPTAGSWKTGPLDALVVCKETQKLLFENAYVRATENRSPAGNSEGKHVHARGVTVAMSDYDTETTALPEAKVSRHHTKLGEVRWAEPSMHEIKNVGTTEQYVVRVELK